MTAYYNDIDPFVCDWLEALIGEGLIAPGVVDRRRIEEVEPGDLEGFTQCHFFAGIGGWSLALRMAGLPDDRPVWTGSCPCQPFSSAGKRKGVEDERHVWPAFHRLISERRPPACFGEQVASADGRLWLAGVFADLEALGYRTAGADLCAAGVGAPHIRQRLYWVADAELLGAGAGLDREQGQPRLGRDRPANDGAERERVGNAGSERLSERASHPGVQRQAVEPCERQTAFGANAWSDFRLVECREPTRDGGARIVYRRAPVEPALFPVAPGLPGRVGILRGAGNAIVPQVAAEFIRAWMEVSR